MISPASGRDRSGSRWFIKVATQEFLRRNPTKTAAIVAPQGTWTPETKAYYLDGLTEEQKGRLRFA